METSKQEAQDRIRQMAERLSAIDGARTALNYIEQQGARIAELEQRPAVPEGFRIFRSPHEGDTDIHLAMKLGDEGYLMSSWLSEGGRDDDDTVGRLAYRLADALLSAQPAEQPSGAQGDPVALDDYDPGLINDHGGGDVGWWQDYIRSEIERANEHWRAQIERRPAMQVEQKPTLDVAARRQSPPDDPLGGLTYQPDGDANFYTLSRPEGRWVARIQFNGELYGPEQERILESMLGDRNVRYGDGYHDGLADAWRDQPDVAGLVDWAVRKWHEQVANRPLVNVHRRTLDGVWRQVIRFAGEDDVVLLGPQHDDMLDASGNPVADPCCGDPGDCWEPCGELGKSEAHVRVHSPDAAKMVPVPYELLCRLADEDFQSEVPDDWVPEMTGPDGARSDASFSVGDLRAAADLVRAFERGEA